MSLILKLSIILAVSLSVLVGESLSEAINRRRIQPSEDYSLTGTDEADDTNEEILRPRRLDKEKLDFPPFPGDDYDILGFGRDETPKPIDPTVDEAPINVPVGGSTTIQKPWYKKIGKFFKSGWNKIRGRRNEYFN